jgi:hypothetical protein
MISIKSNVRKKRVLFGLLQHHTKIFNLRKRENHADLDMKNTIGGAKIRHQRLLVLLDIPGRSRPFQLKQNFSRPDPLRGYSSLQLQMRKIMSRVDNFFVRFTGVLRNNKD